MCANVTTEICALQEIQSLGIHDVLNVQKDGLDVLEAKILQNVFLEGHKTFLAANFVYAVNVC